MSTKHFVRGVTLIEMIMFIMIVSVGIVGILSVLNVTVAHSADPLVQKQAQTLAEGLLEEIQTGYFSYCDPRNPNFRYARNAGECAAAAGGYEAAEDYGPESGEARPFNSAIDYASAANTTTAISPADLSGALPAPAGYTATVTISPMALGDIAAADAILIKVQVSGPGNTSATAEGFKTRQKPL